jgi:hypothetical protein
MKLQRCRFVEVCGLHILSCELLSGPTPIGDVSLRPLGLVVSSDELVHEVEMALPVRMPQVLIIKSHRLASCDSRTVQSE